MKYIFRENIKVRNKQKIWVEAELKKCNGEIEVNNKRT